MPELPEKKRELTMEQRLLLAFVLMFGVLLLSPYFLPKSEEQKQQEAKKGQQSQPKKDAPAANPAAAPAAAVPTVASVAGKDAETPGNLVGSAEEHPTMETDLYKVRFSSRGAVVESWQLKKFKHGNGKTLDLVNPVSLKHAEMAPFTIQFKDQKPNADLRQALYVVKKRPDGLGIDFEYSQGGVTSRKSFVFTKANYLTDVTSIVTMNNASVGHLLSWRGGFGDAMVIKAHANQHTTRIGPNDSSPTVYDNSKGKDGPVLEGGTWNFAGLEDNYFAALFMAKNATYMEQETWSDKLPVIEGEKDEELYVGSSVGLGGAQNQFSLFVGPKDIEILRTVNPKLETVVDWGWFWFLAKPLFATLKWLTTNYIHSYGWAIIVATIVINILLLPIKLTSMKNMKQMSAMQPEIARVNEKYSGVKMNDPRNNEKNAEIMEVYKKFGVNPAGGCLPMFLPIPFLFAFYKVLSLAIDLRGAEWFWVSDLSQPETIAIRVLPLLMLGTQFWLQKMTPTASMDPNQAKMMMFMPLMMGFFFYGASSGLVLYWLTTNVVGIVQQYFFNKAAQAPAASTTIDVNNNKKKGKK